MNHEFVVFLLFWLRELLLLSSLEQLDKMNNSLSHYKVNTTTTAMALKPTSSMVLIDFVGLSIQDLLWW